MAVSTGRADEERRKRLAQALRENLKRRKAQERARKVDEPAPAPAGRRDNGGPPSDDEPA
ncbi:hypothetical protein [Alsobacter sp. R-9]